MANARTETRTRLVIGVGNRFRGDDAVGLVVADRIAEAEIAGVSVVHAEGGLLSLLDTWAEAERVVVIDAIRAGLESGAIRRIDASRECLPVSATTSTHGTGLAEVVELARLTNRMPRHLVVFGIEAARLELGEGLSDTCERAVGRVTAAVKEELGCTNSG